MALYMTPPKAPKKPKKNKTWRTLCTYNTGVEFMVDAVNFDKVKHVRWFENKEDRKILNEQGIEVWVYLGLSKVVNPKIYDFRRAK